MDKKKTLFNDSSQCVLSSPDDNGLCHWKLPHNQAYIKASSVLGAPRIYLCIGFHTCKVNTKLKFENHCGNRQFESDWLRGGTGSWYSCKQHLIYLMVS